MSGERWQHLQDLFHQAVSLEPAEREAFLATACGHDLEMRRQVERLLAAHQRPSGIIENPIDGRDVWPDDEPSAVGRRFGPYRAVRELGRGGMGAVYLGERADGQFEQHVAIKVIKRGMDTAQLLERFRAERQILASLDHPNVARLLDGGTGGDGQPYFVMEYIDGQPIDAYADARALTITQRLELFLQVASAVMYAHQHLIVHRDIKPLNILVTADGVPKLLDFGIAKVLQTDVEEATSTATGVRMLTPDYASPEQVEGRHATTVSDVYSLGVVLYELLTGRSPYRVKSRAPIEIADAVRTTEPSRPSSAVGAPDTLSGRQRSGVASDRAAASGAGSTEKLQRLLRGDLDTIVLTALRKEPKRRYQSVEQLAGDIRRHLEGRPVRARPDTFRYRAGKFVRRNRVSAAAAVLALLALIAGTITTSWQARQARAAQQRAERRFNDVRKLANTLLFDYHDAIKDLRGATPVRVRLVRDALGYLDGLARERANDPALLRELASAYRRVGDVQGGDPQGLGDARGAVESYTKALGILEELFRVDSNDVSTRRDLAQQALSLGSMVWERGDLAAGLAHSRRAREMLEPLVAASPADTSLRLRLHSAYDLLGQMSLEAGEVRQALEFHLADLRQLQAAPVADRSKPWLRRAISVAYGHLADAQNDRGDMTGALESHRRSFDLRAALAAQFPDNADYDYLARTARYYMGTVLSRMGRWEEALALHQKNLAKEPASEFGQYRVGEALVQLGRYDEALPHLRQARELGSEGYRTDSTSLFRRMGYAMIESGICKALAMLTRPDAPATCTRTVAFVEATPVVPTHAFPRAHFAAIWFELGESFEALAARLRASEAVRRAHRLASRDAYRKSQEIWADLTTRKLISPVDTSRLGVATRATQRAELALREP